MREANMAEIAALLLHWRSARSEHPDGHKQSQSKHFRAPEVLSAPPISHQHCRQSGNQRSAESLAARIEAISTSRNRSLESKDRREARLRVLRRRALCRAEEVSSHALRPTVHRRARQRRQQCETEQEALIRRRRCSAPLPKQTHFETPSGDSDKVASNDSSKKSKRGLFSSTAKTLS